MTIDAQSITKKILDGRIFLRRLGIKDLKVVLSEDMWTLLLKEYSANVYGIAVGLRIFGMPIEIVDSPECFVSVEPVID